MWPYSVSIYVYKRWLPNRFCLGVGIGQFGIRHMPLPKPVLHTWYRFYRSVLVDGNQNQNQTGRYFGIFSILVFGKIHFLLVFDGFSFLGFQFLVFSVYQRPKLHWGLGARRGVRLIEARLTP